MEEIRIKDWVWDRYRKGSLKDVSVSYPALIAFAEKNFYKPVLPTWRKYPVQPRRDEDFIEYLFWVMCVNFGTMHLHSPFHKFGVRAPGRIAYIGSYGLGVRFTSALEQYGELSANIIQRITRSLRSTKKFFHQHRIHTIPLIKERQQILHEASEIVIRAFDGKVKNIFEEVRWDAWKLVELLITFFPAAFGEDWYDMPTGERLIFAKRAQLLALVYEGRAQSSEGILRPLQYMGRIGPICDCAVPQVLRELGILEYSSELSRDIIERVVLPRGGRYEMNIRIGTAVAMEELLRIINDRRVHEGLPEIHMGHLDYLVWAMRPHTILQRHLTMTTAY